MIEWQPIETAQKDGTHVLLYDPVYKLHIGSWLPPISEAGRPTHGRWLCWSNLLNGDFAPTHWMPLPEPPK